MSVSYYAVAVRDRQRLGEFIEGGATDVAPLDADTIRSMLQQKARLEADGARRMTWRGAGGEQVQVHIADRVVEITDHHADGAVLMDIVSALQQAGLHVWDPQAGSWFPGIPEEDRWWDALEVKGGPIELRRRALEQLGDRLYEKKRHAQAAPLMEEALTLRPDRLRMARLAAVLEQLPDPDHERRIALLLEASAVKPWWGDYRNASIAAEKLGDLDRAIGFEILAWRTEPQQKVAARLARLLRQNRNFDAAAAFARQIVKHLGENDEWATQQLVAALLANSESAEALEATRRGEALHPGKFLNDLCLLLDQRARALAVEGQLEAGRALILEMLERAPTATNHLRAGHFYSNHLHDDRQAFEHYQRALTLAPTNPWIQANLGVLLYRRGEHDEAVELLRAAFEADPSDSFRAFHHANCLLEMRRGGDAEEVAFRSLEKTANPVGPLHVLGHIYLDLARLDDAARAFRAATACDPRFTKLHHDLFRVALARGDVDGARAHLEDGLGIDAACGACSNGMIELALHTEQLTEARQLLDEAREKRPRDTGLLELAGRCAAAEGDLDVAERQLRELVRDQPSHDTAWYELGKVLIRAGRTSEAIEALEKSLLRNANLDLRRYHVLEDLLRDAGDARAGEVASRRATLEAELTAARHALRGFDKAPAWKVPAPVTPPPERMSSARMDAIYEEALLLLDALALTDQMVPTVEVLPEMRAALEREQPGLDVAAMLRRVAYLIAIAPVSHGWSEVPLRIRLRGLRWGEQLLEQIEADTKLLRRAGKSLFAASPAWLPWRIACEVPLRLQAPFLGDECSSDYTVLDFVQCAHQFDSFDAELASIGKWERTVWMRGDANGIAELPMPELHLPALRIAELARNRFTEIPLVLASNPTLEVLVLRDNPLCELPADASSLRHLRYLDVRRTQLTAHQLAELRAALPDCHVRSHSQGPNSDRFELVVVRPETVITETGTIFAPAAPLPANSGKYIMAATADLEGERGVRCAMIHDSDTDTAQVWLRERATGLWLDRTWEVSNLAPAFRVDSPLVPGRLDYPQSIERLRERRIFRETTVPPMRARMPEPTDEGPAELSFFRTLLADADLSDLTLPRTMVSRSQVERCSFRNADLRQSNLRWNDFVDIDFTEAMLAGADLRASHYTRVGFVRANLRGADLRRSRFQECVFEGADLTGARLTRKQAAGWKLDELQEATIAWCKDDGPEPDQTPP